MPNSDNILRDTCFLSNWEFDEEIDTSLISSLQRRDWLLHV